MARTKGIQATPGADPENNVTATIEVPDLATAPPIGDIADVPAEAEPGTEPSQAPDGIAPELPPKRRRRRRTTRPAEPLSEPQAYIPSPEEKAALARAFAAAFTTAGNVTARVRNRPHWKVPPEEADALGTVWAEAFAPYMMGAGKYMAFVVAGLVTMDSVMPRIERDAEIDRLANTPEAERPERFLALDT